MLKPVYTLGYGGRSLEEFIEILKHYGVEVVIDVRRWNSSMKLPVFNGSNLETILRSLGLTYMWMPDLGGFRKFNVDVEDYGLATCFESDGFRAYATYIIMKMDVKPLLHMLLEVSSKRTIVLMCRERIPWFCHRKILSDYLVAKGFKVLHIISKDRVIEHKLSKCARVLNGELTYV
ncbi:MAG: DUF488 family protein [Desulfurococcaceae archaeon]